MSVSANENPKVSLRGFLAKYSVLIAFAAIVIFFAVASPTFLTPANLFNVLVNNVVMLAIVALGLTIVISSGDIDLSVGVSVDMASMVFVMLLATGYSGVVAEGRLIARWQVAERKLPGLSLAVAVDGKIVWSAGWTWRTKRR